MSEDAQQHDVDPRLLEVLVCPVTKGPLADTAAGWGLHDTSMLFYLAQRRGEQTPFGSILAGFDAVTIVARRGETAIADMRRVIDDLDRHNISIAGSVIA